MRQIAARQHLQPKQRQRMKPFVDQKHQQQRRGGQQHGGDQRRLEPVQPFALGEGQHQQRHAAASGKHAEQVDLLKALEAQRILRQTPAEQQHGDQHQRHHLPEDKHPADVVRPECRQRGGHIGAEGGRERIAAQPVELKRRRQKAQRHCHQHRRQRAAEQPLQHAQGDKAAGRRRQRQQNAAQHKAGRYR